MLRLASVSVALGERAVLHDIDLAVGDGEIVSVLGPSGSGKTTLLRVIAGLERPASGTVVWDGRDLSGVPVHRRGFGLMFQDHALFPHRDVFDNVAFGLRMRDAGAALGREAIAGRVAEVLDLVGLAGFERRSVGQLSGGEQQRVALARTLAPSPALVMLDEPLGSLDRTLRERLPTELRAIFRRFGASVVYVTHDQEEALGVADRTIVLREGRVEADGAPESLWARPPTPFVARFLGFGNVARAAILGRVARTPWGELSLGQAATPRDVVDAAGVGARADERWIVVRPDAVVADAAGPIRGRVATRTFRGDHVRLVLDVGGTPLEIDARWEPLPAVGEDVTVRVEPHGVVVLPGPPGHLVDPARTGSADPLRQAPAGAPPGPAGILDA